MVGLFSCLEGRNTAGLRGPCFWASAPRIENWGEKTGFGVFRLGVEVDRLEDNIFSGA